MTLPFDKDQPILDSARYRPGKVIMPGQDQSVVKWVDGTEQVVCNGWIIPDISDKKCHKCKPDPAEGVIFHDV